MYVLQVEHRRAPWFVRAIICRDLRQLLFFVDVYAPKADWIMRIRWRDDDDPSYDRND